MLGTACAQVQPVQRLPSPLFFPPVLRVWVTSCTTPLLQSLLLKQEPAAPCGPQARCSTPLFHT